MPVLLKFYVEPIDRPPQTRVVYYTKQSLKEWTSLIGMPRDRLSNYTVMNYIANYSQPFFFRTSITRD